MNKMTSFVQVMAVPVYVVFGLSRWNMFASYKTHLKFVKMKAAPLHVNYILLVEIPLWSVSNVPFKLNQ